MLCTNNSFEAENFEQEPTFENTINQIKYNHLKSTTSAARNSLDITSFDKNSDSLFIQNSSEAEKIEREPTFKKAVNKIKDNHLKSITSIDINA